MDESAKQKTEKRRACFRLLPGAAREPSGGGCGACEKAESGAVVGGQQSPALLGVVACQAILPCVHWPW